MIFVEMGGRLGNQLFRYSAARALQLRYYPSEKLVLSFNYLMNPAYSDDSFTDNLKFFNVAPYDIYDRKGKVLFGPTDLGQKILCARYYSGLRNYTDYDMTAEVAYEKRWSGRLNAAGVYWYRVGDIALTPSTRKNKFLSGTFEAPSYFEDYRSQLLKEFTPKEPPLAKNSALYDVIIDTDSVCVSIRRGDYESNPEYKKLYSICDRAYFDAAIWRVRELLPSPVFVLFSDDIAWARDNIHTGCETYYEDGTDPVWEKLRMMSRCKHFIISNSTFSWWCQWLSENHNKVVVSPGRWFNNGFDSPLIDRENWEIIE